jgi:recombination protein RecT
MQSKQQPAGQRGARQPAQQGSVALVKSAGEVNLFLEKEYGGQLARLIPPQMASLIRAEQIIGQAVEAFRSSEQLQKCSLVSIANSCAYAAQLALEVNTLRGHGYLIPYKNVCTFQPGYKGLLELGYRGGRLNWANAQVVHEKDDFEYQEGTDRFLRFQKNLKGDRGAPIAVFFQARFIDGQDPFFHVMTVSEVEKIRDQSSKSAYQYDQQGNKTTTLKGPWKDWADQMFEKTCIKQAMKTLKLGPDVATAIGIDDEALAHGRQRRSPIVSVSDYKVIESAPLPENATPAPLATAEPDKPKQAPSPDADKTSPEYKGALKGENFTEAEWDEVLNGYTELWGWNQAKAEANLAGWKGAKRDFLDTMRAKLKEKRGGQ